MTAAVIPTVNHNELVVSLAYRSFAFACYFTALPGSQPEKLSHEALQNNRALDVE
jgi:hypothetical protein